MRFADIAQFYILILQYVARFNDQTTDKSAKSKFLFYLEIKEEKIYYDQLKAHIQLISLCE